MARTLVPKEALKPVEAAKEFSAKLKIFAKVIELHTPSELIGNTKTLTTGKSVMQRLENGDWLVKSKKTGRTFILGSGNMKLAELLPIEE